MRSDHLKCMLVRPTLWLALLWFAPVYLALSGSVAMAGDSTVTVQFVDTVASQYDEFVTMAVYVTSLDVPLAGINVRLSVSRPDLVKLPDSVVFYPIVNFTGSAISGWDFRDETRMSEVVLNVTGLYNLPGGTTPSPLAPSNIPYRLCSFTMRRVAPISVLDTLQDRTVQVFAQTPFCSVSDPSGNTVGMRDTVYCANPPACTDSTSDTYDANDYISGTLTFGPPCVGRGDVNVSGTINSSDIIFLVNYVFKAGPIPACGGVSGDVQCSGAVTSSDIIYLVNYVFKGGPPPCSG